MYEANGIVYADKNTQPIAVVKVKVLDDMMLLLTFSDGKVKLFDCTQLLTKPAFQVLQNNDIFQNPMIIDGVLTWDHETVDIAPETMYQNGYEYNQNDILVA